MAAPNDPNAGDCWCNTLRMFEDRKAWGAGLEVCSQLGLAQIKTRGQTPKFPGKLKSQKEIMTKVYSHYIPFHPITP
jgi:hypothetical protein